MVNLLNLLHITLGYFGLYIFASGFFLNKDVIFKHSHAMDNFSDILDSVAKHELLRLSDQTYQVIKSPFKRVVLFVVDALRVDFVKEVIFENNSQPKTTALDSNGTHIDASMQSSPAFNQMQYVRHLLIHNMSQSHMFTFHADPPTVTSQRLQGLTAGTLPTFIDAGSNLNSSALVEDNIVRQLNAAGLRSVVLGDDTWEALFPSQLSVSKPMDSFNTRDIYSVDDGIESYLFRYLTPSRNGFKNPRRTNNCSDEETSSSINITNTTCNANVDSNDANDTNWTLLVAHFLGVDHVGHTYHAHHALMAERLQHMDEVLKEVVDRLPADTLLLLFGDHGMTDSGDHGGATQEETDSALFVYSTTPIFPIAFRPENQKQAFRCEDSFKFICTDTEASNIVDSNKVPLTVSWSLAQRSFIWIPATDLLRSPRPVAQVDLVPTLSLLLGLPIPYCNLGGIIPELFLHADVGKDDDNSGAGKGTDAFSSNSNSNSSSGFHDALLQALLVNSLQLMRYLEEYFGSKISKYHGQIHLQGLRVHLSRATDCHMQLRRRATASDVSGRRDCRERAECAAEYMTLLRAALDMCRRQWTHFNLTSMCVGLFLMLLSLFLGAYSVLGTALPTNLRNQNRHSPYTERTGIGTLIIDLRGQLRGQAGVDLMSVRLIPAMAVVHAASSLSNSCVEKEREMMFFIVMTSQMALLMDIVKSSDFLQRKGICSRHAFSTAFSLVCISLLLTSMSQDVSRLMSRARVPSPASLAIVGTAVNAAQYVGHSSVLPYLFVKAMITATAGVLFMFSRMQQPNRVSEAPLATYPVVAFDTINSYLLLVSVCCLVLSWLTYPKESTFDWGLDLDLWLPRVVLLLTIYGVFSTLSSQLYNSFSKSNEHKNDISSRMMFIPAHLLIILSLTSGPFSSVPLLLNVTSVWLLGNAVSTFALQLNQPHQSKNINSKVLSRLNHDMVTLPAWDQFWSWVLDSVCDFFHIRLDEVENDFEFVTEPGKSAHSDTAKNLACRLWKDFSICVPVYMFMWGRWCFFATGHRFDFAALKLGSGFIGMRSFHFLYAGCMLAIDTFGCDLLASVLLLLKLMPGKNSKNYINIASNVGTTVAPDSESVQISDCHDVNRIYVLHRITVVFGSCLCALVHRRHLMVWAVFAPKVFFEGAFFVITLTLHLLGQFFSRY